MSNRNYKKITIEFAHYNKNLDRTAYTIEMRDENDKLLCGCNADEKDIPAIVKKFIEVDYGK